MSLNDREFIESVTSNFATKVRKLASSIPVRGIGNKIHNSDEYILMNDFIKGTLPDGTPAIASFQREVHLMNDLKVKMLIDVDILSPERIQINLNDRTLQIDSCQGITAKIDIVTRKEANLKRIVRARVKTIVSSHVFLEIPVKVKDLSKDRDFIFEPEYDQDMRTQGDLYAHIVNASLSFVQLRNDTDQPLTIQRHARLGSVTEYDEDECFLANPVDNHLAATGWKHKRAS